MKDEDYDWHNYEVDNYYQPNKNIMGFSKEKFKSLLWTVILSVIVSGGGYVIGVGDVFQIDGKALINVLVLTAFSTIIASIKLVGTDEDTGRFLGTKVR